MLTLGTVYSAEVTTNSASASGLAGFPPSYSHRHLDNGGNISPLPEPPTYSPRPNLDEETVAYTLRAGDTAPQGFFIKHWPHATLILKYQRDGARLPTYNRCGNIIGEIGLTNTKRIVSVSARVSDLSLMKHGSLTSPGFSS